MPVTIASEPTAWSFILNANKGNESTFEFNNENFTPHNTAATHTANYSTSTLNCRRTRSGLYLMSKVDKENWEKLRRFSHANSIAIHSELLGTSIAKSEPNLLIQSLSTNVSFKFNVK